MKVSLKSIFSGGFCGASTPRCSPRFLRTATFIHGPSVPQRNWALKSL
jgi:hypothetical protein